MSDVVIHKPTTFSKTIDIIETFQSKHDDTWFRGVGKSSHQLIPSIFRHPTRKTIGEIHSLEQNLATTFDQRSPPFVSQAFHEDWDRMFFMQHYGFPTRLLDWSESPFSALYFALASVNRDPSTGSPDQDVAVWMLDPVAWNRSALSDISYKGGVLNTSHEQVKSYGLRIALEERKNMPVMIHGIHNSPRIVAQRGVFALFGQKTSGMEQQYCESVYPNGILEKIEISKENVDAISKSLFRKGISDTSIYPDLQGLALELRRMYGF